jgi:hypothetical protein
MPSWCKPDHGRLPSTHMQEPDIFLPVNAFDTLDTDLLGLIKLPNQPQVPILCLHEVLFLDIGEHPLYLSVLDMGRCWWPQLSIVIAYCFLIDAYNDFLMFHGLEPTSAPQSIKYDHACLKVPLLRENLLHILIKLLLAFLEHRHNPGWVVIGPCMGHLAWFILARATLSCMLP